MTYYPSDLLQNLPVGNAISNTDTLAFNQHGVPAILTVSALRAFVTGTTPALLALATPTAQVAGSVFTVTGSYANATPAALDVSLDGGATWTAVAAPTISGGVFSFTLAVGAASPAQTVRVRDRAAPTVLAATPAFAVAAAAVLTESAQSAFVTDATGQIVDANHAVWTLAPSPVYGGLGIALNGGLITFTGNVTIMLYYNHGIFQQNTLGAWYVWNGTTFLDATDPRVAATTANETISVTTPSAKIAGTAFTISGTFANAVVTALDFSLNGGATWTAATPTIGGSAYTFPLSIPAANAAQTVRVRDHNAQSVVAVSGSFAVTAPPAAAESAQGASLTGTAGQIVDATRSVWTLVASPLGGLGIAQNGSFVEFTANVTILLYYNHAVYQQNIYNLWYTWTGTAFVDSADPRPASPAAGTATATGRFQVSQGKVYDPAGQVFVARGVNVINWAIKGYGAPGNNGDGTDNGAFLLQLLPKCNMVRIAGSFEPAGTWDTFINRMTAAKVVTILEDHVVNNVIPGDLTAELNWYTSIAAYYKNNPYVWFGTMNEPAVSNPQATANQHRAIHNAIRATGNNNPVLLSINTPFESLANQGGYYSAMSNTIWDLHFYGYQLTLQPGVGTYSTNQTVVDNCFLYYTSMIQTGHKNFSADGTMPIIIGEYGTSTTGDKQDPNGVQCVNAVHRLATSGAIAWCWKAGNGDAVQRSGVLTDFGKCVATYMAGNPNLAWTDNDGS